MNWAQPQWLLGLLVVVGLAVVLAWAGRRHGRRLRAWVGEGLLERVLPRRVRTRRTVRDVFALMGLALIAIALAQPRFDKQLRTIRAKGVDLVLVLDLSRSMDCQDVEPSRLERARREVVDLFGILEGDRVGLVVFSGGAYARLPLTEDLAAVQLVLSELDTSTFEFHGSALGDAILGGVNVLEQSRGAAGQALLVLSDGETHDPTSAYAAAEVASDAGVSVYTLGIGGSGGPIPEPDGGWLMHEGQQVFSKPDDTVLREVARRTGGAYVPSVVSNADVRALYLGEMRNRLVAAERSSQQREIWRSGHPLPLALGVMLLLLSAWIGDGRRVFRALAAAGVLGLGLGLTSTEAHAGTLADADALYRNGEYDLAVKELTYLTLEDPGNPMLYDRLGAAQFRSGNAEGAARAWDAAAELRGGQDADSLYNSGNAHWLAGRLEEALQRYDRALEEDPSHDRAQQNRQLLANEIEQRRLEPPPPPPPQGGEGEDSESPDQGEDQQDPDQNQNPQSDGQQGQDPDDSPQEQGNQQSTEPDEADPGEERQGNEGDGDQGTPDEQPSESGSSSSQGGEAEPITEGQAERLLDGVEEGNPRTRLLGKQGDKPW